MGLDNGVALRLKAAVDDLNRLISLDVRIAKAELKQTYPVKDLPNRYDGMSAAEIERRLREVDMWPTNGGPGRTAYLTLDELLTFDDLVNKRIAPEHVRIVPRLTA